jgi:hypothetical protein
VFLRSLICLKDGDKMSQGSQCSPQLVRTHRGSDPVDERPLDETDAANRPVAGFGAGQ